MSQVAHSFPLCKMKRLLCQRANVQLTVLASQQSVTSLAWLAPESCSCAYKTNKHLLADFQQF